MTLAYVTVSGRGMTDALIAEAVKSFERDGARLAGTVRDRPADPAGHPCDMDLRVLPNGPRFSISQPLGSGSKGCRLDGNVIETLATAVEARLPNVDLLVVNKFGKQEARGRGLCPAISTALELGIPTLVGVNEMNAPEFLEFSGGIATRVEADLCTIRKWFETVQASRPPIRSLQAVLSTAP